MDFFICTLKSYPKIEIFPADFAIYYLIRKVFKVKHEELKFNNNNHFDKSEYLLSTKMLPNDPLDKRISSST